jgi:hypothetical protein
MVAIPTSPQPPVNEVPIAPDGQHTQAWSQYHQKMSDALKVIGQYLSATGGPVALTTSTAANIASLSLPAGDWDVSGRITFSPAPTTHPIQLEAGLSSVSAAFSTPPSGLSTAFTAGIPATIDAGVARFDLTEATVVYLVGFASFTVAGMTASGSISARRAGG